MVDEIVLVICNVCYIFSRLVKPGGVLVYSTCSIEASENSERVAAFLSRNQVWHMFGINYFMICRDNCRAIHKISWSVSIEVMNSQ